MDKRLDQRLQHIATAPEYQEYELLPQIFENCRIVLKHLSDYSEFLDEQEIGPSGNCTMIFYYEMGDINIALDIGLNNMCYIITERHTDFMAAQEGQINDREYWVKFKSILKNKGNGKM